ncbi:MAG: hypothetical protein KDJ97_30685 [Anaerolineae bacterium]|nr:hypothetical protein [Anaerolineae bacterium]
MAKLNGLEGQAHVESKDGLSNWSGYIIFPPNPVNIRRFDVVGPAAKGIYEGPVMIEGKYYFINGNILVRKIDFSPSEFKVEFVGNREINIIHSLSIAPDDYLIEQPKLNIHSQAISNFNKKGLSILSSCKESNTQDSPHTGKSPFPKPYTWRTISSKDIIGEIEHSMRDRSGKLIGRYFTHQTMQFGLEDDDYKNFIKLCEAIQKAIKPTLVVSQTAVEDNAFTWVRERFRGNTQAELIEYILPKIEAEVVELKVWVPIAQLRIESDIHIGNIVIRPVTEEVINQWRDTLLSHIQNKKNENVTELFGEEFKKRFQGWPAGVIKLIAEPIAAREIALRETERSLAMLRIFSIAALTPKITCYSAVMGRENIETTTTFLFKNNFFTLLNRNSVDYGQRPWNLDRDYVIELYEMGLGILSELLRSTTLSKFQKSIIDSLTLYSQATREKELSNKLVYLLAALEGIFLKNDTEPIQQNLGERIATLIGKELEDKKDIIRNIKTTYGLRSRFLHHAHTIDDYSELEKFMLNAWCAMSRVIENHNRFATKQDFVSAIDDLKLAPHQSPG